MSTTVIVIETTPAKTGIKETAAGKDDNNNTRNCNKDIFDKDKPPVIFSGDKKGGV
jgi:hypothetical protein